MIRDHRVDAELDELARRPRRAWSPLAGANATDESRRQRGSVVSGPAGVQPEPTVTDFRDACTAASDRARRSR